MLEGVTAIKIRQSEMLTVSYQAGGEQPRRVQLDFRELIHTWYVAVIEIEKLFYGFNSRGCIIVLGACENPQFRPIFVDTRNVCCAAVTVDVEGRERTCSSSQNPPHL